MLPSRRASASISPPGVWVEGLWALRINGRWYLYFEMYTQRHFGLLVSADLAVGEDGSRRLRLLRGAQPGCVGAVEAELLRSLGWNR